MENRVAVPLCIYAVTAIWCWLTPSRLRIDDVEFALNIFPTKALALATVALAIVHWTFALRGRVVVSVASLWAVATTWMVTMFIFSRWLTVLGGSVVRLVYMITVAGAACALCVLAWHLVRRRIAVDAHWITRGLVALGVAVVMEPEKADPLQCRGGVGTIGWPGAYGSWWQADPNDGSVMIFLAHNMVELQQMARGIGLGVWSAIATFHGMASA